MGKLEVDKLDPESGTALEIGTSGDTVTVPTGVGLTLTNATLLLPTTINTDKLDPKSGTALEIGTSGDTITIPTGAGLTVVDEVKTNKISPATGTAFALGDSGDTFTVPSGATIVNSGTATGFGGGKMLQVQQYVSTAHTVTSTATTFADITDFEIAITPVAASSKILVHMNFHGSSAGSLVLKLQCDIDSAGYNDIYVGDADGSRSRASTGTGAGGVGGTLNVQDYNALFLHTPSYTLTDVITYKTQWLAESNPTGMCLNKSTGSTNFIYVPVTASSLTVIEVAA